MGKWINIFRTGTHTDSSGRTKTYTKTDLDKTVAFGVDQDEGNPLVLGHPKEADPAYGWATDLRRSGELLQAQFAQIPEELRQAMHNGRYKNRSISLTPEGRLRHVGLLGAVPPAVKGLGELSFNENDDMVVVEINFNEADAGNDSSNVPNGKETDMPKTVEELEAELAIEKQRADDEADGRKKAEDGLKAKDKEFSEEQAKRRKAEINAKLDGLVEKGTILPADKDRLSAFAEALDTDTNEICFSEGDGKKPLINHFWEHLESGQSHGLFEEFAGSGGNDAEPVIDTASMTQKF